MFFRKLTRREKERERERERERTNLDLANLQCTTKQVEYILEFDHKQPTIQNLRKKKQT